MALSDASPEIGLKDTALECWNQYLQFIVDPKAAARAMGYTLPGETATRFQPIPFEEAEFLSPTDAGRDSRVRWLMKDDESVNLLAGLTGEPVSFTKIVDTLANQVINLYVAGLVTYNPNRNNNLFTPEDHPTKLQVLQECMNDLFDLVKVPENPEPGATQFGGREFFSIMDRRVYPIVFGTALGEFEAVEIFRISPMDSRPIAGTVPVSAGNQCENPPLRGAAYGAFGGFLDQQWRLNDMLRGRLDGTERLITAILPDSDQDTVAVRERLICAAQEAIAAEWSDFQKQFSAPPARDEKARNKHEKLRNKKNAKREAKQ
jgi:hypothetical protein